MNLLHILLKDVNIQFARTVLLQQCSALLIFFKITFRIGSANGNLVQQLANINYFVQLISEDYVFP